MSAPCKAWLIDPYTRSITPVRYTGNYTNIYQHCNFDTFAVVHLNRQGDTLYVDDEGLLTIKPETMFFHTTLYPSQPLAGKGLVLGSTRAGHSKAPHIKLDDLAATVTFLTLQEIQDRIAQGKVL